jgi:hypothetical protein
MIKTEAYQELLMRIERIQALATELKSEANQLAYELDHMQQSNETEKHETKT